MPIVMIFGAQGIKYIFEIIQNKKYDKGANINI
jgi:hypothetical protein